MSHADDPTTERVRPLRTSGVELRRAGATATLVGSGGEQLVVVNDTAAALWELCDGQTTVEEMVEAICELFAGEPEQLRTDVIGAIDHFRESGVITLG